MLYDVAAFMRRGDWAYESLESAASQWGFISQIPLGRVMVVTTGASGEVSTPYGVVEYSHTDECGTDFYKDLARRELWSALPIANKARTLRDLVKRGRSLDLIDWEAAYDED